jgi:hypothetical protein
VLVGDSVPCSVDDGEATADRDDVWVLCKVGKLYGEPFWHGHVVGVHPRHQRMRGLGQTTVEGRDKTAVLLVDDSDTLVG